MPHKFFLAQRQGSVGLLPESDVERLDGRWVAKSKEPWLAFDGLDLSKCSGRLAEITYRASLWDEPARPIFRFWQGDDSFVEQIGPAPIAGAAIWIGRIPAATMRISVSPTNRFGQFDFVVEAFRLRSWLAVMLMGLRRNPRATRSALLTRLIGWHPESDVNLAWAIGALPMRFYAQWSARRARAIELEGLDRPRFDWTLAPLVTIIVAAGKDHEELGKTLDSLRAQAFPHWQAHIIGTGPNPHADPRIVTSSTELALNSTRTDVAWTCILRKGDRLVPFALAYLVEQARRHPSAVVLYGETLFTHDDEASPQFAPRWSPRTRTVLQDGAHLVFVRNLGLLAPAVQRDFVSEGRLPASMIAAGVEAWPLHRIMLDRPARRPRAIPVDIPSVRSKASSAAIIIPTRDHPVLLRRVVESIRTHSRSADFEIVIVDNGSVTPAAIACLAEIGQAPDVTCVHQVGPFDFSRMCNEAAAATRADILVFLNDDTVVLSEGWLDRLTAHAKDPGLGAIGAKLTYPDGRIQHIGVTIGLGGSAGHFGALDPADAPGWDGRNLALHEVSAVTGACLAVARDKFEAVGGFDATHLPVELSDVDLCLKLNERGWQTVVDPLVHLMHEESVSRGGATFRRLDVYENQRAVFADRWRHVLRDDPFFHPALSLYSLRPALG